MKDTATKLKVLMEKKSVTAYRIAKEIGYTTPAVYMWVNGEVEPKLDAVKKLSDYFGVPISYFTD